MRIVNYILLLFAVMASCQSPKEKAKDEEKFQWNAGISAPKNYIATPFVEYFYQATINPYNGNLLRNLFKHIVSF